jgi:hypothetical protein
MALKVLLSKLDDCSIGLSIGEKGAKKTNFAPALVTIAPCSTKYFLWILQPSRKRGGGDQAQLVTRAATRALILRFLPTELGCGSGRR